MKLKKFLSLVAPVWTNLQLLANTFIFEQTATFQTSRITNGAKQKQALYRLLL